jgi:hypothetical protein
MKHDLFSIPVFVDKIDLTKIELTETEFTPTWQEGVESNYMHGPMMHPNTYDHLAEIIEKNLIQTGNYTDARITHIWRNKYTKEARQEVHIHANSQWSFIIYETVERSKTVFLNPSWKMIDMCYGTDVPVFPFNYQPDVEPGTIIIFPSFIEHYVLAGNEGLTIAGNIELDYVE